MLLVMLKALIKSLCQMGRGYSFKVDYSLASCLQIRSISG